MKIHSDFITAADLPVVMRAVKDKGRIDGNVVVDWADSKGSRSRKHGTEFSLGTFIGDTFTPEAVTEWYVDELGLSEGDAAKCAKRAGRRGSRNTDRAQTTGNTRCANWLEWGAFIWDLFMLDPKAVIGTYDGVFDFANKTGDDRIYGLGRADYDMGRYWDGRTMAWIF